MGRHTRQAAAMLPVLVTSILAVRTSPGGAGVSPSWVASAIGACAMVASPRRHAPVLFVGVVVLTWAGNVLGGRTPASAPRVGLANAIGAYVIARLLTRNWSIPARLHSWFDLRRYFVVMAQEIEWVGLSIARCIAEALGVAVGFRCAEGVGSTFWVEPPLVAGP